MTINISADVNMFTISNSKGEKNHSMLNNVEENDCKQPCRGRT